MRFEDQHLLWAVGQIQLKISAQHTMDTLQNVVSTLNSDAVYEIAEAHLENTAYTM